MTDKTPTKEELEKAMDELIAKAVEDETNDGIVVFESEAEEIVFRKFAGDEDYKKLREAWEKDRDKREKNSRYQALIGEWDKELANHNKLARDRERKEMKKKPNKHQEAISRSGWFLRIDSWDEKSHQFDYFKEYVHSLSDNTLGWLENESKETQMDFFVYCDRNPYDEDGFEAFRNNEGFEAVVEWIAAVSTVIAIGLLIYLVL